MRQFGLADGGIVLVSWLGSFERAAQKIMKDSKEISSRNMQQTGILKKLNRTNYDWYGS